MSYLIKPILDKLCPLILKKNTLDEYKKINSKLTNKKKKMKMQAGHR